MPAEEAAGGPAGLLPALQTNTGDIYHPYIKERCRLEWRLIYEFYLPHVNWHGGTALASDPLAHARRRTMSACVFCILWGVQTKF